MYSAQRAIIRLERSNDSRSDPLQAPKSFRMLQDSRNTLQNTINSVNIGEPKENLSNGGGGDTGSNSS